ncbi:UrcA family protein [Sphingomonas parva]|nr:UrcA family protein [Sphingomonas parva]
MSIRTLSCACAALLFSGISVAMAVGPAAAQPVVVTASREAPAVRRVSYADLNLETEAGRKALNGRIRRAISFVCGDRTTLQLREAREQRDCARSARRSAVAQLAAVGEGAGPSQAVLIASAR